MKHKSISSLLLAVLFLLLSVSSVLAATLQLNGIGTSSTEGKTFTEWWYSGENPQFVGDASASAEVTLTVNDAFNTVTADVNGAWVWTPVSLLEGDHTVSITSGTESIDFTLHISTGSATTPTPTATPSGETKGGIGGATESGELLETGAVEQTIALIGGGMALIGIGMVAKVKMEE